ncbi:helix-hairpin-helix domain-containing protein [Halomicroarcula sp. GCM10025710]
MVRHLTDLEGVGPAVAERLRRGGYDSVAALSTASPETWRPSTASARGSLLGSSRSWTATSGRRWTPTNRREGSRVQ